MSPLGRRLTRAAPGAGGLDLRLGLGASELGLGLAAAISLAGLLAAQAFCHG
jgi:hypothetical protein